MVNTFLKTSLSKIAAGDPEPFHPTIIIAYKRIRTKSDYLKEKIGFRPINSFLERLTFT